MSPKQTADSETHRQNGSLFWGLADDYRWPFSVLTIPERNAVATAPGIAHNVCELVTRKSVSDRQILFAKCLLGSETPKDLDLEVINAELKADPTFKEEVAQMIFSAMMLHEIFEDRPLGSGIKRRRSHGPRAK